MGGSGRGGPDERARERGRGGGRRTLSGAPGRDGGRRARGTATARRGGDRRARSAAGCCWAGSTPSWAERRGPRARGRERGRGKRAGPGRREGGPSAGFGPIGQKNVFLFQIFLFIVFHFIYSVFLSLFNTVGSYSRSAFTDPLMTPFVCDNDR